MFESVFPACSEAFRAWFAKWAEKRVSVSDLKSIPFQSVIHWNWVLNLVQVAFWAKKNELQVSAIYFRGRRNIDWIPFVLKTEMLYMGRKITWFGYGFQTKFQMFKDKKINFSPAILKLETLLYQNIYVYYFIL